MTFPAASLKLDIQAFQGRLNQILISSQAESHQLLEYILTAQGKWIRPSLVLSFARLFKSDEEKSYQLAVAVEYIHSASLVHDDIVDEAEFRRGLKSVHRVWDEKRAVLIGDFLYSRAFELIGSFDIPELIRIFASVANRLSQGELKQLKMKGRHGLTKKDDWCYEVIKEKTAVFFGACCEGGVLISGTDEKRAMARQFGCVLGMIFQMRDDLLDYGKVPDDGGKDLLQDLSKGKVTLPLLYAYQGGTEEERELIHQIIEQPSSEGVSKIYQIVNGSQAYGLIRKRAIDYAGEAREVLTGLPAGDIRDSLFHLVDRILADI